MLNITSSQENKKLVVFPEGRIDTTTSNDFNEYIKKYLPDTAELILDFSKVEYISSAGLRVVLSLTKVMNKQGSIKIINASEEVKEVFDITGFSDIIPIE